MVAKDSPYKTITELVDAWKANPKGLAVGGGSVPGGPDHLLPMQLAQAVGIKPTEVNYIAYDGGGDLLPAVLGGKVAFGASGVGEFLDQVEAGEVRVLAVSGERKVAAVDAPTLKESNIDLVFTNWRGVVAPPELSDADKAALVDAVAKMHATEDWKAALEKNGWTDAYVSGRRVRHLPRGAVHRRRGCADRARVGMSDAAAAAGQPSPAAEPQLTRSRVPDFVLCAGLAVAGIVVLIDALRLSNNVTGVDPLGPKPVPVVVGGALIVLAGLLAARGGPRPPWRGRGR